jgi:peptide/nickel transport system ATP-binding protein
MYLGEIVELAPTDQLFERPQHPYTKALLSAIPRPDPHADDESIALSGSVPSASDPPDGCRFHTRCPAVLQPDDINLEQSVWRAVLDFRERLADGDLANERDALRESDGEDVPGLLRERSDLPASIDDPAVADAVDDAIERLCADDAAGALEALTAVVRTPCEETAPRLRDTGAGWQAACLLHDDAYERQRDVALGDD